MTFEKFKNRLALWVFNSLVTERTARKIKEADAELNAAKVVGAEFYHAVEDVTRPGVYTMRFVVTLKKQQEEKEGPEDEKEG